MTIKQKAHRLNEQLVGFLDLLLLFSVWPDGSASVNRERRYVSTVQFIMEEPHDPVTLKAQDFKSFSFALAWNLFPSTRRAPLQELLSAAFVVPMPLPPEVANGIIVFPVKSYCSRKELIMVGAIYHQMGNQIGRAHV